NLQKHPAFLVNVDASMTGNLFDVTFDGQSAIIGRRRGRATRTPWIGQNPDAGFLAVAPWIAPDPGMALSLAARRALLATDGAKLLPGSGVPCGGSLVVGACENGYREAIVHADVEIEPTVPVDAARAAPPHFGASVRIVDADEAHARHPPWIAARGRRVFVVWQETRGRENVYLAVSRDGGRRFGAPVHVTGNASGAVAELNPALAVRGRHVTVVWQEGMRGGGRIMLARFDVRGRRPGRPVHIG